MTLKQGLRLAVAGILGAAYLWLGHLTSSSDSPPLLGLLVGMLPLSLAACALAWHSRPRWLWLGLCGAALLAMALNVEMMRSNAAWVYFIQHAGSMLLLGLMFGRSLASGRHEAALCSRIAGVLHTEPMSLRYLDGAEVDYKEDLMGGGFAIKNPNAKSTCGCGHSFSS